MVGGAVRLKCGFVVVDFVKQEMVRIATRAEVEGSLPLLTSPEGCTEFCRFFLKSAALPVWLSAQELATRVNTFPQQNPLRCDIQP